MGQTRTDGGCSGFAWVPSSDVFDQDFCIVLHGLSAAMRR